MSLVNKMLRDLDARHVGDGDRAALPAAVTPLAARRESRRVPPGWWLGAVLIAGLIALATWYSTQRPDASSVPPVVVAVPAPAVLPVPAVPTVPPVPVVPAVPTVAAAVPKTASVPKAIAVPGQPQPVPAAPPKVAANAVLPTLRMAVELSAAPAAVPQRNAAADMPKTPKPPPAAEAVPRQPAEVAPSAQPIPVEARIEKQVHLPSAAERAEIAYRRGVLAQRQGNAEAAAGGYRAALDEQPEHAAARQALAALLIEAKRFDEAEELLRQGTELVPVRLASTLALARLKVERNQAPAALELLQKNAAAGERSADYQGFTGALLNRAGRASEAVEYYQAAVRLAPNEGRWWAGLGIALDAAGKGSEAREAYQKARSLPGLPADLAQHIEQRLR